MNYDDIVSAYLISHCLSALEIDRARREVSSLKVEFDLGLPLPEVLESVSASHAALDDEGRLPADFDTQV